MEKNEVTKLRWEDYKFRQAHYWTSLTRFTGAILVLLVIPFVKPELVKVLGLFVLIFPVIALLLSLASTWLLGAEYQRLAAVKSQFEALLGDEFKLQFPNKTWLERFLGKPIGPFTTKWFGWGFSLLSVVDILLLLAVKEQLVNMKVGG